ncbi:Mitotic checkpoint protein BUB3.2 [Thalictrum thalictroides]|uniref:Mitotic checkpoint protein BUB3.2 n=1 Tax=Thalictrum thalictroides TaxID=46969 RepID=A0A7J6XCP1_THATH|nr:Mitotic checkpoint protein BUB3.2 [Thalictrum thalictroides]
MSAIVPPAPGKELFNPPTDGISNLRFSNHSDHLLVSSWDKSVRLYDATSNVMMGEFLHGGPVLDCCFHDDSSGFSASADNSVRRYVFSSGKEDILGRHDAPVRCIEYSYAAGSSFKPNQKKNAITPDYRLDILLITTLKEGGFKIDVVFSSVHAIKTSFYILSLLP